MKEIKNDIIKKYQYLNYVIYEKEQDDFYEYYLQNEKYGIIQLIFGLAKGTTSDRLSILINNIDKYIEDYQKEVED